MTMNLKHFEPEKRAGLWIDHKNAYLVALDPEKPAVVTTIECGLSTRPDADNQHSRTKQQQDAHREHELQAYYQHVIDHLKTFDFVFVLGPGEARNELRRALLAEGPGFPCKIAAVHPSDKLTRNQLVQKVRRYFNSLSYEDSMLKLSGTIS